MPKQLKEVLEEERKIMNGFAATYDYNPAFSSYFYTHERKMFMNWVLQTLKDAGRDCSQLSVLETGMGTGKILSIMANAGCTQLTGIDIAQEMLSAAKINVPNATLIHDSIEEHDFGTQKFDVIIGAYTVHHLLDRSDFFRMVDRVLKPGGWVFLQEYEAHGWANAPWSRPFIEAIAAPFRCLLKWKNRHLLPKPDSYPPADFNSAHQLMTYKEILQAIPAPQDYSIHRSTRGVFLPAFNYALSEKALLDRILHKSLDTLDLIAKPFGAGNLQWIAMHRKMNA